MKKKNEPPAASRPASRSPAPLTRRDTSANRARTCTVLRDNILRLHPGRTRKLSALALRPIPSAVGYQPTLATDMGRLQRARITTTTKARVTRCSDQAARRRPHRPCDRDPILQHLDATTAALPRDIAREQASSGSPPQHPQTNPPNTHNNTKPTNTSNPSHTPTLPPPPPPPARPHRFHPRMTLSQLIWGEEHYAVARRTQQILSVTGAVFFFSPGTSSTDPCGMDELSREDKLTVSRAPQERSAFPVARSTSQRC